jgi:hypothetical protein
MSLLHAKEAFRDAQRNLNHRDTPELYDFALGMRLLVEGLEAELQNLRREVSTLRDERRAASAKADRRPRWGVRRRA